MTQIWLNEAQAFRRGGPGNVESTTFKRRRAKRGGGGVRAAENYRDSFALRGFVSVGRESRVNGVECLWADPACSESTRNDPGDRDIDWRTCIESRS